MTFTHRGSLSERVYSALLCLNPREFREEYADEMREFFSHQLGVARQNSFAAVTRLWVRALRDVGSTAVIEHWLAFKSRTTPAHQAQLTNTNRSHSMFNSAMQDLRFAFRALGKNPVFTMVAVAVVALGTGAVSTMFSVANSTVLRPVPGVANAADIVTIERTRGNGSGSLSASYAYYEDLAENSKKMSGVAAWSLLPMTVSTGAQGVSALGNIVSGNYFDVLGVRPALGRFFQGDEGRVKDTYPVVVISHEFWNRQFGGDSAVVGRQILLNGQSFTVIGVAAPRFSGLYPVLRTDAWVPLMMQRTVRRGGDLLASTGAAWLEMFGRVAPGVSPAIAQSELSALTKRRSQDASLGEPAFMSDYAGAKVQRASGLPADATGPITLFLFVLIAVAGLVLLIASVNVASMLLARAVTRRREIAVRIALGAGRARLIGQLMTESVLLFTIGGALGTLIAVFGTRALQRIELPVDMPMALDFSPDYRVLLATLAVALLTGVAFGLAPALRASRTEIAGTLRNDTAAAGSARSRLRNALVVGQVAVSLLLLTVSGLFVRALDKGRRVDVGMNVASVGTAALQIGSAGYDSTRGRQLYREFKERLAATPGVTDVGFARMLPLSMNSYGVDISIPGYVPASSRDGTSFPVLSNVVDEGYFAVTKVPVVLGRGFQQADNETGARVVIVNETMAAEYWPGKTAIGQVIEMDSVRMTVVGVVQNAKYNSLNEGPVSFMYLPFAQHWTSEVNILVRTSGSENALAPAIRKELHALDATLPVPVVTTLRQATAVVLLPQRVAVLVTGVLGFAGLMLAGIGLYGVISFSTAQRTREIGVRVALGAARTDVLRLVVGEGMLLVGIGMAVGLILAVAATRALTSFLFGVSPLDFVTFVLTAAILAVTALLASYLPARRAATIDPMLALRQE